MLGPDLAIDDQVDGDRQAAAGGPVDLPSEWLRLVNQPQCDEELVALRRSAARGRPYGQPA